MSKYQARLFFLYPFLLGVSVLLVILLFIPQSSPVFTGKLQFMFGVITTSSVISFFATSKKDQIGEWATAALIVSLIIIWALVFMIMAHTSIPVSSGNIIGPIVLSVALFIVSGIFFVSIRSFFEWIFKEKTDSVQPETNTETDTVQN